MWLCGFSREWVFGWMKILASLICVVAWLWLRLRGCVLGRESLASKVGGFWENKGKEGVGMEYYRV